MNAKQRRKAKRVKLSAKDLAWMIAMDMASGVYTFSDGVAVRLSAPSQPVGFGYAMASSAGLVDLSTTRVYSSSATRWR